MKTKKKHYINIGGCPYLRKAQWGIHAVEIVGYDINTERHLIVNTPFEKNKRIELDDEKLILTECE